MKTAHYNLHGVVTDPVLALQGRPKLNIKGKLFHKIYVLGKYLYTVYMNTSKV